MNLDESLVRNEFKIWIYKNYFLHSIRFLLTVHELPPSSLQKLDAMATKFLKTWAGLPKSSTLLVIHSTVSLSFPSITKLYEECYHLKIAGIRVKGDKVVQNMLDIKIDRENQWKRKVSTASKADKMVKEILEKEECSHDGPKMQCHMGSVHEETKDVDMGHMKTDQRLQK